MTVKILIKQITDYFQNELQNAVLHKVSGAPGSPVEGQFWYDTATQTFKFENASTAINVLDRANHTGTQLVSTISDRETWLATHSLSVFAVPTADLPMGTHKITGLTAGSATGHAVEFDQLNAAITAAVNTAVAGLSYKAPVDLATTANIANVLTGAPNTLDGVAFSTLAAGGVGARLLVKDQSTPSQNGIYTVTTVGTGANGVWARATDADTSAELTGGSIVPVDLGTVNADKMYMLASDITTVGTTAQTWNQFGAGTTYTASLGVQLVGADFRANLGTGLTLSGSTIVPDYTGSNVMKRKVATGSVATSGVDVVVNHAFGLAAKDDLICQVYETGVGIVQIGVLPTDVNNVTLSFGVTPTTNQYKYALLGLT